jgi:hypothetical protein
MTAYLINPDGSRTPIDQTLTPREQQIRQWDSEALAGQTPRRSEGQHALGWFLILIAGLGGFFTGLFINVEVEASRPATLLQDGYVNVEGHGGEVLVVGTNGQVRWCEATDHHCHGLPGG